jgi:hypothetical protein
MELLTYAYGFKNKVPEGPSIVARQFTGGSATENVASAGGTPEILRCGNRLRRPYGTCSLACCLPGVETPGYCHASLRDALAFTERNKIIAPRRPSLRSLDGRGGHPHIAAPKPAYFFVH